jgi:hypothetical protein
MSDHGTYEESGYGSNVRELRPRGPVDAGALSCPMCGNHGTSSVVDHPGGKYFCSCGSLFNGSDHEWRALAKHREQYAKRRGDAQSEAS